MPIVALCGAFLGSLRIEGTVHGAFIGNNIVPFQFGEEEFFRLVAPGHVACPFIDRALLLYVEGIGHGLVGVKDKGIIAQEAACRKIDGQRAFAQKIAHFLGCGRDPA